MKRPSYREVATYIVNQGSCSGVNCSTCPFSTWVSTTAYRCCEEAGLHDKITEKAKEYLAKPGKYKEKITRKLVESILTADGEDLTEWEGIAVYAFPTAFKWPDQPNSITGEIEQHLVGYFPREKV